MPSEKVLETLATLDHLKPNTTIALAVDMANDDLSSICCIAVAWISGANVRGIYYYVKPSTDDFTVSRNITAETVQNSDPFNIVWDRDIRPLLKNNILSAYKIQPLFQAVKASYEESGKCFTDENFIVQDLLLLAKTYIPNLGNDSLTSITHKMNINVDLDSTLSRAMACVCAIDWINVTYSVNNVEIPLKMILGNIGHENIRPKQQGFQLKKPPYPDMRNPYIFRNPYIGLGIFIIISIISMGYFMFMQNEMINNTANDTTTAAEQQIPSYEGGKTYYMAPGTYVVLDKQDTMNFATPPKANDTESVRSMVKDGKVIVFSDRTAVKVIGKPLENGFVPVIIADDRVNANVKGFAPYTMINDQ